MSKLQAKISRGNHKGELLYPHQHEDGKYVASTSRFKDDYIRVDSLEELDALVRAGYGARMSNSTTGNAPSFIVNSNIYFEGEILPTKFSATQLLPSIIDQVDLDIDSNIKRRKEQSFLRAHLLQNSISGICVICQHEFPFDMLVAAHLKKRSVCTNDEKLDFNNIAVLMCKTGCDDLYEKGYITVKNKIVTKTHRSPTPRLDNIITKVVGNEVSNWSGSYKYYEWHHSTFSQ